VFNCSQPRWRAISDLAFCQSRQAGLTSSLYLQARGHWFDPSCAHQVRGHMAHPEQALGAKLGAKRVKRVALAGLSEHLSTRSLQIAHNCLERAIRHAQASDIVGRNVATLVRPPAGREGRPSKALNVEQAQALVNAARGLSADGRERLRDTPYRLCAYIVLLLMTGLRPEEPRALRWDHVDLEAGTVAVWRSDRAGGDTKTPKSRRTLKLAMIVVRALAERRAVQAEERLKAGELWQDNDLVFSTAVGTAAHLRQHHVRRRHPGRGDRQGRWTQANQHDGADLPQGTSPSHYHGRRGNGPDLHQLTAAFRRREAPRSGRQLGDLIGLSAFLGQERF
jgi:integrase